eukprot:g30379.t1
MSRRAKQENKRLAKQSTFTQEINAKEEGNRAYARGDYKKAIKYYQNAMRSAKQTNSKKKAAKKELESKRSKLCLSCHLNISQCAIKLDPPDLKLAIQSACKALDIEPNNVKGLYRRAMACQMLGDPKALHAAKLDWAKLAQLDPEAYKEVKHNDHTSLVNAFTRSSDGIKTATQELMEGMEDARDTGDESDEIQEVEDSDEDGAGEGTGATKRTKANGATAVQKKPTKAQVKEQMKRAREAVDEQMKERAERGRWPLIKNAETVAEVFRNDKAPEAPGSIRDTQRNAWIRTFAKTNADTCVGVGSEMSAEKNIEMANRRKSPPVSPQSHSPPGGGRPSTYNTPLLTYTYA